MSLTLKPLQLMKLGAAPKKTIKGIMREKLTKFLKEGKLKNA